MRQVRGGGCHLVATVRGRGGGHQVGRGELPVDGGVFDITQKDGKSIIPIRNALAINKPVAFVITLEQPGGVVKSKQEIVVALAKS